MRTRLTLVLMLVAAMSLAATPDAAPAARSHSAAARGRDGAQGYAQYPLLGGRSFQSQLNVQECADDLMELDEGDRITKVRWWGVVDSQGTPLPDFLITFYDHDPELGNPGDMLDSRLVKASEVTAISDTTYEQIRYTTILDPPFDHWEDIQLLWISIQAQFAEQWWTWKWCEGDPLEGAGGLPAMYRTVGVDAWSKLPDNPEDDVRVDMSIVIWVEQPSAVEPSSWGVIKALFR